MASTIPRSWSCYPCNGRNHKEKLDILRDADYIFRDEIAKLVLIATSINTFAVLTSTRTVGVMGDFRTYDYTLALRGVTTTDFMTADWAHPLRRIGHNLPSYRKRSTTHQPYCVRYYI